MNRFLRLFGVAAALFASAAALFASMVGALAQQPGRVQIGVLECRGGASVGFIVG
jgi:hypothetical protein